MIQIILMFIFIVVGIAMIIAILMQRARGGGLAGAFGGGASDNFLGGIQSKEMVRFTTWLAIAFFVLAIFLDFFPPDRKSVDLDEVVTSGAQMPISGEAEVPDGEAGTASDDLAPVEEGGEENQ
jgi:preprotein translocase subunit SecG